MFLASVFLTTLILPERTSGLDCEKAKEYQIVKKADIKEIAPGRFHGHWYITTSAETHIEFAHTAIQAVMNLYDEHKMDITYVSILPTENLYMSYGWAAFAADSLGGLGLSGADQDVKWDWRVFVAHQRITQQQIDIAEMWFDKAKEYPNNEPLSSSSIDKKSLRKYIAKKLKLSYEEIVLPIIHRSWYLF